MTKRLSVTLKDDEYAAVLLSVAAVFRETGVSTNPTEYIRTAIIDACKRDLNVGALSELNEK